MPELYSPCEVAEHLREQGYNLVEVTDEHLRVRYDFNGRIVHLLGKFTPRFPFEPPEIYVVDRLKYGHLAHVGWRKNPTPPDEDLGLVCKGVSIARSVNFESPELVFEYGLEAACDLLATLFESDEYNLSEVLGEFSGHWRFHCEKPTGRHVALIEPSDKPESLLRYKRGSAVFTYCPPEILANDEYGLKPRKKDKSDGQGIYIPISTPILPPRPEESILEWWHDTVLPTQSQEALNSIEHWCRKHTKKSKPYSVIMSIDRGEGQISWAGFLLKYKSPNSYTTKNPPPLFFGSSVPAGWRVEAFNIQIHNQSYLLPRGGADKDLSTEKILLIGCGSLGGEIARLLAYSGVGQLDLFDFDTFETNNIYRHVVPSTYLGVRKTEALKYRLQHQFPYLEVEEFDDSYKELKDLASDSNLERILSRYDGVILATGDVTQERHFNNVVQGLAEKPWLIFSWLEGYGVGGHCVYVHPESEGCLSCLFRDPELGTESLQNIQNFLSVDQDFAVDLAGCGTHFLPYGYVDVVETATLTMRLVESVIGASTQSSVRSSWKGTDSGAKEQGLALTGRWKRFQQDRKFIPLTWSECPVCGSSNDL